MKRCSRCILPETYPNISYDKKGVCSICSNFENTWKKKDYTKSKQELEKIFDFGRKKGKKYNCLVPLSGGKDSTYVLYACKRIHNLEVLAVNFDNGFQSNHAKANMEKVVEKLDVDYISFGQNWDLMQKLYKIFLVKTGDFCTPCCVGIRSTVFRIAEKERIPLIVGGAVDKLEITPSEIADHSQRTFKAVLKDEIPLKELENFLYPSFINKRLIKYISYPSYIDWDEKRILEIIKNELGWGEGSANDHSDCLAASISNYIRYKKWGFARKTTKCSALVRDGQMSRKTALKKIAIDETDEEPASMNYFLEQLDLTREDINKAIKQSNKEYIKPSKIIGIMRKIKVWNLCR